MVKQWKLILITFCLFSLVLFFQKPHVNAQDKHPAQSKAKIANIQVKNVEVNTYQIFLGSDGLVSPLMLNTISGTVWQSRQQTETGFSIPKGDNYFDEVKVDPVPESDIKTGPGRFSIYQRSSGLAKPLLLDSATGQVWELRTFKNEAKFVMIDVVATKVQFQLQF